jgi:hypothetical protein
MWSLNYALNLPNENQKLLIFSQRYSVPQQSRSSSKGQFTSENSRIIKSFKNNRNLSIPHGFNVLKFPQYRCLSSTFAILHFN